MSSKSPFFGLRGTALRAALIICIVAPGFTLYGYNQSGLGPISTLPSFEHLSSTINTSETTGARKSHNSVRQGAVIASFQLGALFGAISCLLVGDALGRRKTVFLAAALTLIGSLLQVSSYSLVQFVIGRVIIGLGVGEISVMIPVWLAECSTAVHRGRDVITAGIFLCFGYALCNWVDYAFFKLPASALQWRLPLAVVSLPMSVLMLVTVFFLPESPRWLAKNGQMDRAASTLAALRDLPGSHEAIAMEMAQIESSLEITAQQDVSLYRLFREDNDEKLLYRFLLCFFTQFAQQVCGGSLISVYASTIFHQNLGLGVDISKILASCALTWKFLCCFIAFIAIDRWGRRAVFMVSGAGMSLCMLALSVSDSFQHNRHASITSAFFIFLFNFFYPIGFLGANFLYISEVAPLRLRVTMNSISTGNHWLWNFVITIVTPVAINNIGYKYYIMYTVLSAFIPFVVYFFFPETKNRSLEALNNVFREASGPFEVVSMARKMPYDEIIGVGVISEKESEQKSDDVEQRENA